MGGACSMVLMALCSIKLSPQGGQSRGLSLCPSVPLWTNPWSHNHTSLRGWKAAPGTHSEPCSPYGQLVVPSTFQAYRQSLGVKVAWVLNVMWGQLFPNELITLMSLCLPWTFLSHRMNVTSLQPQRRRIRSSPCWPWGSSFTHRPQPYELLWLVLLLTFMSITFYKSEILKVIYWAPLSWILHVKQLCLSYLIMTFPTNIFDL